MGCIGLIGPREYHIVLQKATRVHGRLTAGAEHHLITKQRINILQQVDDAYRELSDRGFALKTAVTGGPNLDRDGDVKRARAVPVSGKHFLYHRPATTNGDGEFETFLGPGKYQLRYGETVVDIELNGEPEHEVNLHAQRPTHVNFVGRVVLEGSSQKGVANATVTAYGLDKTKYFPRIDSTTDAKGNFRFARVPVDMVLYARDEEGSFAQIVQVAADDQSVIIELSKAASAHGRLIDAATGHPVRNARINYGIPWELPRTHAECGGTVQTDEQGEFVARGLVTGRKYMFAAPQRFPQIATIEPQSAEVIELGTYRVDLTGKAGLRATGLVAAADVRPIFKSDGDGNSRLAAARQRAKAENKRVLLVLGADWSAWCHRLNDLFRDNAEVAAALDKNFVVLFVDVDDAGPEGRNADLVERYCAPDARLPHLAAIEGDGLLWGSEHSQNLEEEDHFSPERVLAFLESWKRGHNGPAGRRGRAVLPRQRGH